jgi:lipopolysaccharide transport system ATP-binding protein
MYARLAFAVAAHVDADILIVDEILAVGDAAFTQKCMRYIQKFKESGTLLFVSHDASAVNALCDRAIWMDKGQIRAEGPAKDVNFAYQAALREETDGEGFSISGRRRQTRPAPKQDFRHALIRGSDKRNLMEVFEFDPDAPSFGKRGGRITNVRFHDRDDAERGLIDGGDDVTLEVTCAADSAIARPIVGFYVKDRLGQNLFGDNTFITHRDDDVAVPQGSVFKAVFRFRMPYLPPGDYAVTAALAEGTQDDHVQHHWMDDALFFRCESGHIRQGLLGIPMDEIRLEFAADEDVPDDGTSAGVTRSPT